VTGPGGTEGAALTIRSWRPEDLDAILRFRARPADAALAAGAVIMPETADQVRRFLEDEDEWTWIWADESGSAVGYSVLSGIDWLNRTLRTGSVVLDPRRRGRGLGTLGRRLVLDLVFNELDFRRVYGEFAAFNEASRRSHLKLGAEILGSRRQAFFVSGQYHDAVMYTVARDRFNALFPPDPLRHLGTRAPGHA
jgi:diamine N-acetyltransferase